MKRWVTIIVIAVLIYLGWRYFYRGDHAPHAVTTTDDPALILDRVWVDSKPERYTDYLHALVVVSDVPFGAFQKASAYRGEFELFEYTHRGNELQVVFPQTDTSKRFKYRITRCDELPPFDLCLRLTENPWGGPRTYYGFSDGDVRDSRADRLMSRVREALSLPPSR